MQSTAATPPRAGARQWAGLAVLMLPTTLIGLDQTVLHLAIPKLAPDLGPSATEMLWITDIYGFLIAGLLVTMGNIGDRIGRRKLLMIGATVFALASVMAAFSVNAEMLIATRALLGAAGATLMPSTIALLRDLFLDDRQRTIAIAVWGAAFSLGNGIGPVVGGLVLDHFWWGSVFLLGVPIIVLMLVLAPFLLPESRQRTSHRPDLISAGLSLVTMLTAIFGVKHLAEHGFSVLGVVALVVGVLFGVAFTRRQKHLTEPMMDLRLFRIPAFSTSLAAGAITLFAMIGGLYFVAQYLQLVHGMSALESGLWMLPVPAAGALGTLATPMLSKRFRPASVMTFALLLAAAGSALVAVGGSFTLVVVGFPVAAVGIGLGITLATDLIITVSPPKRAGAAAAMSETGNELGAALGVAIMGSVGAAVYRSTMANEPGAGAGAKDSLAEATVEAGHAGGSAASSTLEAAKSAFESGYQAASWTTTGLLVLVAALAAITLRRTGTQESVVAASSPEPETTGAEPAEDPTASGTLR